MLPEALVFQSKVKTGKWNQIPLVSKLAQINTNMQTISYHLVSLLIRCKWEKHADEINHIRRGSYWGRNSGGQKAEQRHYTQAQIPQAQEQAESLSSQN